eukprot:COSAG02_NODE_23997_length_701_cov_1.300664_1_plen_56_part_01
MLAATTAAMLAGWQPGLALAAAAGRRALAEGTPPATLFDGTWETVGRQMTIADPYK